VSTSEGTRRTSVTRWTLGLLGPAVLLAIAFLPWAALWSRLPDPVAVHWDLSGRSDASQARGSVVWEAGAIVAVLSAGLAITVVVATRRPREPIDVAWPAGLLSFFGALLAAASATTTLANADADGWRDAELPPWWAAVVVAVALVGGWSGARLGARLGTARPVAPDGASTMPLDPGELVAWSGRCTAMRGASAYGVVTLLAAVATAVGLMGPRSVLIPLVVVSVPLLALFSVRVTAGAHGLKVRLRCRAVAGGEDSPRSHRPGTGHGGEALRVGRLGLPGQPAAAAPSRLGATSGRRHRRRPAGRAAVRGHRR
jgi:hypothetical protein